MDSIAGVEFIEGDFTEDAVFEKILAVIDGKPVDLVISDMAPNMSGMSAVDQPRSIYLVELALDMARQVLAPGGALMPARSFALLKRPRVDQRFLQNWSFQPAATRRVHLRGLPGAANYFQIQRLFSCSSPYLGICDAPICGIVSS